ncbi:HRAS-like suppressor 2 [Xiphophorus maculatus]|uniref:HRAS-like suppressor 2 n=1 Tax=Xiphophorus maculatus TaxID=8083 RepID=UPI0003B55F35|nr:HRAS-like suppressor 2 [Xiphophorus maculatus]
MQACLKDEEGQRVPRDPMFPYGLFILGRLSQPSCMGLCLLLLCTSEASDPQAESSSWAGCGRWYPLIREHHELLSVDRCVSTAEIGQLIEFVNPWLGLSPWGVYTGEGYVIHFGVGDENMPQQAGRSFLQLMAPKSKGDRVLKKTRISRQRIPEIRVPAGTRISVNNKHNLTASPLETIWRRCETFLHQEFKYDLVNFNSEHFATFVQYGHAVSN